MSWTTEQLLNEIRTRKKVIIELGCGPNPDKDVIGIDLLDLEGVNFVTNLEEGLAMIPDNSVDEVRSRHFFEHVQNFDTLIKDIHRMLKTRGITFCSSAAFCQSLLLFRLYP